MGKINPYSTAMKTGLIGCLGSGIIMAGSLLYKPEIHPQTLDAVEQIEQLEPEFEKARELYNRGISYDHLITAYDLVYSDGERHLELTVEKAKHMKEKLRNFYEEIRSLENRPDVELYREIEKDLVDTFRIGASLGYLLCFVVGLGAVGTRFERKIEEAKSNTTQPTRGIGID